jgi:hypothetical protein
MVRGLKRFSNSKLEGCFDCRNTLLVVFFGPFGVYDDQMSRSAAVKFVDSRHPVIYVQLFVYMVYMFPDGFVCKE